MRNGSNPSKPAGDFVGVNRVHETVLERRTSLARTDATAWEMGGGVRGYE